MHFDSFLPTTNKFGMIYTLVLIYFSMCFSWTNFHHELVFLKDISEPTTFKSTPSFNCSKENLNNCSSFRGELSLQTRTKLQKVLKRTLSCCKIQIVFKNQRNPLNVFHSEDRLPYDLVSCIVYKFQCGRCNASYYGETDMHLKVR